MLKKSSLLAAILSLSSLNPAGAQLAITETFSSASTNNTLTLGGQGPDFWELTNFGTNGIDLSGYRFNDADATLSGDAFTIGAVVIGPGESVIFAQNNTLINTVESFTNWWGLPPNQQVVFYTGNGQSSAGDSIVLWDATASNDADFLDRADFGEATTGLTFTYNTTNAVFGVLSSNSVNGAFVAATSDDIGSPGAAQGPVTLAFATHPTNLTGYVGFPVTLYANARGLPRPRYQWFFGGTPIDGETRPSLTITNVQLTNGGNYAVVITNGLATLASSNAVLTVDASPSSPSFVTTPVGIDAYEGQTVTLSALAQANPAPGYQWRSNGVDIIGETSGTLVLSGIQTNFTATYSVVAANIVGSNIASAVVTVTTKPKLYITEAHSTGSSAINGVTQDWWELTNLDGFPVRLRGCRFDDSSPTLAAAVPFTNDITIHPGETIILVENMSPAQFRSWWGTASIPASVQILSYGGNGVSLSSGGDALYLFNAAATVNTDFICAVSFGSSSQTSRRSFVMDPDAPFAQTPFTGNMTLGATNGLNGVFAATTGDFGSPGRYIAPLVLSATPVAGGAIVSWDSVAGRNYEIDFKTGVTSPAWITLTNVTATGTNTTIADIPGTDAARIYRGRTILPVP